MSTDREALVRLLTGGLAAAMLASGCSSQNEEPTTAATQTPRSAATQTPRSSTSASPTDSSQTAALVGEWQRTQKCPELVKILTANGMQSAVLPVLAEDDWIPGVSRTSEIENPAQPCEDAVARKHSHFFTADGAFGSRDANGEQVDDGEYRLIGKDTVVVNGTKFHYKIIGDDTVTLDPVVPGCAPKCFRAIWSVVVAYPGYTWHRIS
jgi:hypothetical protein